MLSLAFAALLVVGLLTPATDAAVSWKKKVGEKELKVTFYGFAQLEMRQGDGLGSEDGIRFSAQRIRWGSNYHSGNVFGKLFLDFNQSWTSKEAGLPKAIKDAFVGYKFSDAAYIKVGMMKAPHGMGFTIPGWNLDNIERSGLDKGLVLERDFGIMLSGRLIGGPADQKVKVNGTEMGHERWGKGFGYDIGVFNPAGRSKAVMWDTSVVGDALAYAARLHYDHTSKLHLEASMGKSEQAGGVGTEDYESLDFGVNSFLVDDKLNLKFEYITGENILGLDGREQDAMALTIGYRVIPTFEFVVKHYDASATRDDDLLIPDTDLTNTYIGFSWYLDPLKEKPRTLQNHRIQLNYVFTGGDDDGAWTGMGGYQDTVMLAQYQIKF